MSAESTQIDTKANESDQPKLLDVPGVARLFNVSEDTVYRNLGQLPKGFRLGRKTYWLESQLFGAIGGK